MAHLRPTSLTTNIRVHARQLDLQPDLRLLPRHPRSLLRGVEQTHRPALAHHVHRPTRLGSPFLINGTWYKDFISHVDLAALGGRARKQTCSMKLVIRP